MLVMIAAIGKNRELGKSNNLIWHLPGDLKFFKEQTMHKTVVMGKNTFNSLPKMLPRRKHIILSDDDDFNKEIGDSIVFYNKDKLIEWIKNLPKSEEVFIIGGASMYNMFINLCHEMYLTEIDAQDEEADVYFPEFDKSEWNEINMGKGTDGNITYIHKKYIRKNN